MEEHLASSPAENRTISPDDDHMQTSPLPPYSLSAWKPTGDVLQAPSCCDIDKTIKLAKEQQQIPDIQYKFDYSVFRQPPFIQIISHVKSTALGGSSSYTLYTIQTSLPGAVHCEARHRYSEFEALRKVLMHMHPTCIVPPIPEKQSIGEYASKPTTAKEDPNLIEKRKRMLQAFLNRVLHHPVLSRFHAFHMFLQGDRSWSDIVSLLGLSDTLKLKDETATSFFDKTAAKRLDPSFTAADDFSLKFSAHIIHLHKLHRKITKQYLEVRQHYVQLGLAYNSWSLVESPLLSHSIEKVGEAFDAMGLVQQRFNDIFEHQVSESFQEYTQFAAVVERAIKWRYMKFAEFHRTKTKLEEKEKQLQMYEVSENEALRISAIVGSEGISPTAARPSGFLATINSLIDHDPEQTRRKQISKLRDRIQQLQHDLEKLKQELAVANTELQSDLDRFQLSKLKDFKNVWTEYAQFMRQYHAKNREIWRNVQAQLKR